MIDVAGRFSENLVRCRRRAGISQEKLGIRASLQRTQIGTLERGGHHPRIDTLVKLAGALDVTPNDLLEGIVWRAAITQAGAFGVASSSEPLVRQPRGTTNG